MIGDHPSQMPSLARGSGGGIFYCVSGRRIHDPFVEIKREIGNPRLPGVRGGETDVLLISGGGIPDRPRDSPIGGLIVVDGGRIRRIRSRISVQGIAFLPPIDHIGLTHLIQGTHSEHRTVVCPPLHG